MPPTDNPETLIPQVVREATRGLATPPVDLTGLPVRVNRHTGAELVTRFLFPVSPRSLEVWPLTWRRVNGYAVCETAELFAVAQTKLDAAPPIRGGKRAANLQSAT